MRSVFMAVVTVALVVLGISAKAQNTQPQVWQGEAFVTGFSSAEAKTACEGYAALGDYYRILYRPIIPDSPNNGLNNDEGLSFFGSRNALHYYTDGGVSFNTPGNSYVIYLGTHGQSSRQTNYPAGIPFHLKIAPQKIALTTKIVTMFGSLNSWEDHLGCNVEISAALTARID